MAAIRSADTKPEIYIRKMLFANGYRFRLHNKSVPGHPDIWLKKFNTAIFIHGCFWHRHRGCKYATTPATNSDFWDAKFRRNVERDQIVKNLLAERGIKCLIIWECSIKRMKKCKADELIYMDEIKSFMDSDLLFMEI